MTSVDHTPQTETPRHDDCPLCHGTRNGGPACLNYHQLVDLYNAITLDGAIFE